MDVTDFGDLADEFLRRCHSIVWCTVTTLDTRDRPRSRILHPIWEVTDGRPVGWIATTNAGVKARHLAHSPWVSCSYWTPAHEQVFADCRATWVPADDRATKQRIWEWFAREPAPLGYDLGLFWKGGVDDPGYSVLRLDPWRVEVSSLGDMMTGKPPLVWRSPDGG